MNKPERQKRLLEITNGLEAVAIDCIQNNRQPEKWVKDVGWLLHEFEKQSADVERLVEALRKVRPIVVGALAFVDCNPQLRELDAPIAPFDQSRQRRRRPE